MLVYIMHFNFIEMKYLVFSVSLSLLFLTSSIASAAKVEVTAIYDDPSTYTTKYDVRKELRLACNVSTENPNYRIVWEKDGDNVQEIDIVKDRVRLVKDQGADVLRILNSLESDGGNYTCVVEIDDREVARARIVAASNILVKTQSDINVIEGENLRIPCAVHGNPPPAIVWFANGTRYNESSPNDRIKLEKGDKNIPNSVFIKENVILDDRGEYTCFGYAAGTKEKSNSTTMVRIKGKYAALWPFLGICAEVFILCAIILVYEKKRNKTELEESDTDQSPEQKNTPDHEGKDSNLRHRQ